MAVLRRAPALSGPVATERQYYLAALPDGPAAVRITLGIMRSLVREARRDPRIRELAEAIIENVPEKDSRDEVDALRRWIRTNVRYTDDINEVETLKSPVVLLETLQGDCDDQATLMAALAESIGKATRFAALAFRHPEEYEHVLTEVKLGTRWIPAETTEDVELGWYPTEAIGRMVVHV